MNPRTTIWLTGLAVGMFLYILLVERHAGRPTGTAAAPAKLLASFEPAKVSSIEIVRSNQTIRVDRLNDQWQLRSPAYPAQSTAIEAFLNVLNVLQRQTEISAQEIISESGGLSPFGLDPPTATFKVTEGTNLIQFRVGSKTLLGDRVYVQPVGASGIFTTEVALWEHLPAHANQWRNPLLMSAGPLAFDRIAITSGSRSLKLERDTTNQLWRIIEPAPSTRADFGQVEHLLRELRDARVSQFVSDNPKADLEPFGLQTPETELSLSWGTNLVFQLQFGASPTNDPGQVYARSSRYTNVVLLSRDLAQLVQRPSTDFRDRVLLSFRPSAVDRIEGQVAESGRTNQAFAIQRTSGTDWQLVEPYQASGDRQLMQLFLQDLARIEIIRFEKDVVADFAPYGLTSPARQYALKTSLTNAGAVTNQLLLQVDFGSSPTNEPDKVYCRRSDEKSVYAVAYADMNRLARAAYVLRDRRIWTFASSNVNSLSISQRGQKRQISRDPVHKRWFKDDQVADAAVEEVLHRLGQLQADDWVARGQDQARLLRADGSEYQLTLNLSEQGRSQALTLNLRLGSRGQPYGSVLLEGQLMVFKIPADLYAHVLRYLGIPTADTEL